ncbi:phytanoyl-CoA dioxygenase family protein [Effusibacillus pohliae]|uniref:phytanoyl-CoA dioxygenase family protein n=1 Tax=Effusibacillus pohliae TaxID=232270 RepID=UPI0003795838|nr:phytanoyl-CoA dioxygenase family protein [Effusibacillus pohliae]
MNRLQNAVTDLYPSRVNEKPAILERKDPVIYADASQGPLDAEQLAWYEKNGYLFFERLFSTEEVQELRDELRRIWQDNRDSDAKEVIREPESREIRSVFAVTARCRAATCFLCTTAWKTNQTGHTVLRPAAAPGIYCDAGVYFVIFAPYFG